MRTPRSRNEQRTAHCRGEVHRGCGRWPFSGPGSPLEPPFEPFTWSGVTEWDLAVGGYDAPHQGRFIDRLKRLFLPARAARPDPRAATWRREGPLDIVLFRHYHEDDVTQNN